MYDNSPGILSVYWTKDGKKIDINETGGRFSQVTVDKPSLKIKDVNLDDIGDYQLTATNAVGSTTCDVIKLGIIVYIYDIIYYFFFIFSFNIRVHIKYFFQTTMLKQLSTELLLLT